MKIVAFSDTHGLHNNVEIPDGDIVIFAGDFSTGLPDSIKFFDWYRALPHKYKILVAGNHDWIFEKDPGLAKTLCHDIVYLQDDVIEIEGIKIFGSPYTPRFFDWAFNEDRGAAIKKHWDKIPDKTDIIITHGPPHGILDFAKSKGVFIHQGCEELKKVVDRIKPQLHVFGHLHFNGGKILSYNDTEFANVAIVNEAYTVTNKPFVTHIYPIIE